MSRSPADKPADGPTPHAEETAAWRSRLTIGLAAGFGYVTSEWLFFATKPSFLNSLPAGEQLLVLVRVATWLMLPLALAVGLAGALARLGGTSWPGRAAVHAARLPAALCVAATLLLLADNFLYTATGWGTPRLEGSSRWLGITVFLALLAVVVPRAGRWEAALGSRPRFRRALLVAALLVILAGIAASPGGDRLTSWAAGGAAPRWNVVLVGGDGVSAERLASFGGPRTTTPFLDRLAEESLLAVNVLPNAGTTGGSLVSMLTSALPTETRMIYPPDVARGPWRYRHLPGLLKGLGYLNGQFSQRWNADALDANLRDSFDWANGRVTAVSGRFAWTRRLDADGLHFLELIRERLVERVVPSAASREGRDAHREILDARTVNEMTDRRRLMAFQRFVIAARRPFFAHLHVMGTHGPRFHLSAQRFSLGQTQTADFELDFYDDAILDFDRQLELVVRILTDSGQLERTLLVVYSDHGMRWNALARVPLLVRAPAGALSGRIERRPAQLLDVAPTVLELLGQPVPDWMGGRSLLDPDRDPCPEIFGIGAAADASPALGGLFRARSAPPFFSLAKVALTVGRQSVMLDLDRAVVSSFERAPAGELCPTLAPRYAAGRIVDHLAESGYDVSSLRARLDFDATAAP